MTKTKCQQEFEKWAKATGYNISYDMQGTFKDIYPYLSTPTTRAYNAWRSAWDCATNLTASAIKQKKNRIHNRVHEGDD